MFWLVMLSQLLAGTMQARLYGGNAGFEGLGDLGVAAALLHEGEQRAVLGTELGKGVAEGVELLAVDRAVGLGHVLVLRRERQEDPAQLLPPQVVDARVAGQPEEPGFELGGGLKAVRLRGPS